MKKTLTFSLMVAAITIAFSSCNKEKGIDPSITTDTIKIQYITSAYRETLYPGNPLDSNSSAGIDFQIMVRVLNETDNVIYFSYPEIDDAFHIKALYDTVKRSYPKSVKAVANVDTISYRIFRLNARTSGIVSYNASMVTRIPTIDKYQLILKEFRYSQNGNDNTYESVGMLDRDFFQTELVNP